MVLFVGVKLPCRTTIATTYLDKEYEAERQKLKERMRGRWVTLSVDGWSTPQNAPWTGVSVNRHLFELTDSTGNIKDAEYMAMVSVEAVRACEGELACRVASVTGDNARNMVNSRTRIEGNAFFCYGCQAHLLNLCMVDFLKEKNRSTITSNVLVVLKSFRATHALRAGLIEFNVGRPPPFHARQGGQVG